MEYGAITNILLSIIGFVAILGVTLLIQMSKDVSDIKIKTAIQNTDIIYFKDSLDEIKDRLLVLEKR